MEGPLGYQIVPAYQKDENRILKFLQCHFFPHEPINLAQKRMPETPSEVLALCFLSQGHSLLAVNSKDPEEIIGVALSGEISSSEVQEMDHLISQHKGTKYGEVLEFLRTIIVESRLWELIQVKTAFKTHIITVHTAYRGQRIGQHLLAASEKRAEFCKFDYLVVDCTSCYAAAMADRLGFRCIYHLPYSQYLGRDGNVLIPANPVHTGVRMFIKQIPGEAF